jgi:DNA repair exonuclease SbcCD ATPase subunit
MSERLTPDAIDERIEAAIEPLREQLEAERQRRREAEQERDALRVRVADVESESEALRNRVDDLTSETQILHSRVDGTVTMSETNTARIAELQARELEKGAHLQWDNVDGIEEHIIVDGGKVERFTDEDGQEWARLPGEADPLDRSSGAQLAISDLLPIQQLARMDDEMLRSSTPSLPAQLAAKAWRERETGRLWNDGCGTIGQYIDASELRAWIRREESGISKSYAKKLVSRTLDAIQELTKNRVYVERRNRRKDGLQYKERRLILPADSEIPGETTAEPSEPEPQEA